DENGKYSANGSALLNPPVGMKANEGFEGGAWSVELPETVSGTDEAVFIYSYTKAETPEIPAEPIDPVDPTEPENPSTGDSKMLLIAAMSLASVFGIAKLGFFRRREY
ncbi:MAG: hypothetical protein II370_07995, partial [Clostridia bacterium]|nr:hypothetical protein [Clostridia bacterium]